MEYFTPSPHALTAATGDSDCQRGVAGRRRGLRAVRKQRRRRPGLHAHRGRADPRERGGTGKTTGRKLGVKLRVLVGCINTNAQPVFFPCVVSLSVGDVTAGVDGDDHREGVRQGLQRLQRGVLRHALGLPPQRRRVERGEREERGRGPAFCRAENRSRSACAHRPVTTSMPERERDVASGMPHQRIVVVCVFLWRWIPSLTYHTSPPHPSPLPPHARARRRRRGPILRNSTSRELLERGQAFGPMTGER